MSRVKADFQRAARGNQRLGVVLFDRLCVPPRSACVRFRHGPFWNVVDAQFDVIEAGEAMPMAVLAHRGLHLVDPFCRRPTITPKRLARLAAISQEAMQGAVHDHVAREFAARHGEAVFVETADGEGVETFALGGARSARD